MMGDANLYLDLINSFLCQVIISGSASPQFPCSHFLWIPGDEVYLSNAEAESLLELPWDIDPWQ